MAVKRESVRGTFYDNSEDEVTKFIVDNLNGKMPFLNDVVALMVPHAGHFYSGKVAISAFLQLKNSNINRVFIFADNHESKFLDRKLAVPSFDVFEIFGKQIPVDTAFIKAICEKLPQCSVISDVPFYSHIIEVQLPFLQHFIPKNYSLVPMIFNGIDDKEVKSIADFICSQLKSGDLIIVSSDMTHYLPQAEAVTNDNQTLTAILRDADIDKENSICGPESMQCLRVIARKFKWMPYFIDYSTSMSASGGCASVVGYGALAWTRDKVRINSEAQKELLALAHDTILAKLEGSPLPSADPLLIKFPQLCVKQSVFVTLMCEGRLRGCIGSLDSFENNIADGVQKMAIQAAFYDPRFESLTQYEFEKIDIKISILGFSQYLNKSHDEWVPFLKSMSEKPGVILDIDGRTSTFLPEVWDDLPDPEDFLCSLSVKQGKRADDWKSSNARLYLYSTQHF